MFCKMQNYKCIDGFLRSSKNPKTPRTEHVNDSPTAGINRPNKIQLPNQLVNPNPTNRKNLNESHQTQLTMHEFKSTQCN